MSKVHCIILFDGTTEDRKQSNPSNVVKIYNGLIRDHKQIVIYESGIGNDLEWKWTFSRLFAEITGYGAGWVMNKAYHRLINELKKTIQNKHLSKEDTVYLSVGGFSRGAALARQFVHSFLQSKLQKNFPKMEFKIKAEYLFDTVPAFGIPLHIKLASFLGIKLENRGWNFSIPEKTKAYHAVSIDERRWAFKPTLVDHVMKKREEVWFAGDHGTVGGGYPPPTKDSVMADCLSLQYIARRAHDNGLKFTKEFKEMYLKERKSLRDAHIETPSWNELPSSQQCIRKIHVLKSGHISDLPPVLDKSVIHRIKKDEQYRPAYLPRLKEFLIRNGKGKIKSFDEERRENLLKRYSAAQPDNVGAENPENMAHRSRVRSLW